MEELARRKIEALNLYEPLPVAQQFHECTASERIVRGSNRASKTLTTHVELARAVLNQDPYKKYPKKDGRSFLVGYRNKELGEVNYRKLFRIGAFKIIRDDKTKEWRTYRPWQDYDRDNKHLARPAPALIPARYHHPIAWESKKENIPASVKFVNGWELNFFSSQGAPPTGSDIDIAVFDEEMENPNWYPEISARLVDRGGKFVWGATPQAGTEQLYDLCESAQDQRGRTKPRTVEFFMSMADNKYLTDDVKQEIREKYENDPTQYSIRIEGEFAVISFKFYPEFHEAIHGVNSFPIPSDWTRYAITDPGHQPCSVLFIATPPPDTLPEFVGRKYIYDELVIPNCNATIYGREMARKCGSQQFQAFIIDGRAGRITDMGSGRTLEEQYSVALKQNKVSSVSTGHGFMWGSDDTNGRAESVRQWLQIGPEGHPTLHYFKDVLKVFPKQMIRYHYHKVGGQITDKPRKKNDHLVDCVSYGAAFGCPYRKPKVAKTEAQESRAMKAIKAKNDRKKKAAGGDFINLGPGKG